ncbi:AB hydrolase superfamily protein YvaM [Paenibacillus konkukensis]|uniref:AB hydrolase superfamily protein YvaM n=1 Tax=Paenibacillus konkukensis TaxID=2020716 RepID=A0ABY4RT11_9BACL|nr:alpha/beta hydrolase [Paenibacillus konkukensis]UQZ85097.1 AB hydrolase superfamily protein YvaM [Paenibacillus konkukensis]
MPMATVNGAVLHYDSVGTGVPIVFIHPPLLTGEVFVFQRELRDRFRIITFDVRGHGLTKPEGAITYAAIAADMVGLLDALNIPKAYVGLAEQIKNSTVTRVWRLFCRI